MISDNIERLRYLADNMRLERPSEQIDLGNLVIEGHYTSFSRNLFIRTLLEVADFLERGKDHYITINDDNEWAIQHSLECREKYSDLTQCQIHRELSDSDDPFYNKQETPGRYKVIWDLGEYDKELETFNWTMELVDEDD